MEKLYINLFFLLLFGIIVCGCTGNSQVVQSGTWGGQHIGLFVSDSSTTLEYDCAHGTIDEPILTDDNGMFEVTGIHIIEKGGPIRLGEIPDKHPSLYNGTIEGKEMTLIVTLTDTDVVIDTFYLTLGKEPIIYKCL